MAQEAAAYLLLCLPFAPQKHEFSIHELFSANSASS